MVSEIFIDGRAVGPGCPTFVIAEIGDLIRAAVPDVTVSVESSDDDSRDYRVNLDKMRYMLDFHPTLTVENGIDDLVGRVKSGEISDYKKPTYRSLR